MQSFVANLFYFLMFLGNGFFVVKNGTSTFLSHTSSGIDAVGLALAFAGLIYFARGAHNFVDGLFRFKYGVSK